MELRRTANLNRHAHLAADQVDTSIGAKQQPHDVDMAGLARQHQSREALSWKIHYEQHDAIAARHTQGKNYTFTVKSEKKHQARERTE